MRLLYLRVVHRKSSETKPLAFFNQDINFTGEHHFYWEDSSATIKYRPNPDYFSNLYGNTVNITAIAGANGSGKTTLLKFIRHLIEGLNGSRTRIPWFDSWEWCCVVEENGKPLLFNQGLRKGPDGNFHDRPDLPEAKPLEAENFTSSHLGGDDGISHVYYSPHLELFQYSSQSFETDISTEALFDKAILKNINTNISGKNAFKTEEVRQQLVFVSALHKDEIYRNDLSFLTKLYKSKLYTLPILDGNDEPSFTELSKNDQRVFQVLNKTLDPIKYLNKLGQLDIQNTPHPIFKIAFEKRLLRIVFENIKEAVALDKTKIVTEKAYTLFSNHQPLQVGRAFFESLDFIKGEKYTEFQNTLDLIYELIESPALDTQGPVYPPKGSISLETCEKLLVLENELLNSLPYPTVQQIFAFDWGNLSTGEKAYLNLFSRFYSLKHTLSNNVPTSLTYFLIDEPATGFHPQWQKEYLKKLVQFIDYTFIGVKELVITTHSPYVASDLQKEDIIRLHSSEIIEKKIEHNTFGANIHELLADGFYLQNGFMGDFAREKIKSLIEFLDPEVPYNSKEWTQEKAKAFIKIVGEPLLQQDLNELYFTKYNNEIDAEIERLQALKNKKK